jgi:hypothetical protein
VLLTEILRYSSSSLSQGSGTLPKVRKELLLPLFPCSVQCLTSQPVPKFAQHEEVKCITITGFSISLQVDISVCSRHL